MKKTNKVYKKKIEERQYTWKFIGCLNKIIHMENSKK